MLPWSLAKFAWLLYIGLILAGRTSSQTWYDNGFSSWSNPQYGDYQSPYYYDWNSDFENKFGNFFSRMMQNMQQQMRYDFSRVRSNSMSPEMKRLLHKARAAFDRGDDGVSPRKIVRTGSCGSNCNMKVVLTRNNGEYYEKWSQSARDSYSTENTLSP